MAEKMTGKEITKLLGIGCPSSRRRRTNMGTDTYMVLIDKSIIAMALSLEHAVVLVKALFNEYYAEPGLTISIQREQKEDA